MKHGIFQSKQTHFTKLVIHKCLVSVYCATAINALTYCYNVVLLFHCFMVITVLFRLIFGQISIGPER